MYLSTVLNITWSEGFNYYSTHLIQNKAGKPNLFSLTVKEDALL